MGKELLNNQKITALSEAWGIMMHDKTIEAFTERQSFYIEKLSFYIEKLSF